MAFSSLGKWEGVHLFYYTLFFLLFLPVIPDKVSSEGGHSHTGSRSHLPGCQPGGQARIQHDGLQAVLERHLHCLVPTVCCMGTLAHPVWRKRSRILVNMGRWRFFFCNFLFSFFFLHLSSLILSGASSFLGGGERGGNPNLLSPLSPCCWCRAAAVQEGARSLVLLSSLLSLMLLPHSK